MAGETGVGSNGNDVAEIITAGLAFAGLWKIYDTFSKHSANRAQRGQAVESARFFAAGVRLQGEGRLADAVAQFSQALAKNSANSDAANVLAWIFATHATSAEDLSKAMLLANRSLDSCPVPARRAVYLNTRGEIYLRQGLLHEAVADFRVCIRVLGASGPPPAPAAWYRLGLALSQLGDLPEALAALTQAVAATPDNIHARMTLAHVARESNDNDRAISEYTNAYQFIQDNRKNYSDADMSNIGGVILNDLGCVLLDQEREDDAEQVFHRATIVNPAYPYPSANLAIIAGRKGDENGLRKFLNKALAKASVPDEHLKAVLLHEAATSDCGETILDVFWQNRRITNTEFRQYRVAWQRRREEQRKKSAAYYVDTGGGSFMASTGDFYLNEGPVGAQGHATNHGAVQQFNQAAPRLEADLGSLAAELARLKARLLEQASEPGHYNAVAEVDFARQAAEESDRNALLRHLRAAGQWALSVATAIGTSAAETAIRAAMNGPG